MSIRKCTRLEDAIDFIKDRHRSINMQRRGVNCWKILRRPNGKRIVFEEMNGVRIKEFSVHDFNTLVIEQQSHGSSQMPTSTYSSGKKKVSSSSSSSPSSKFSGSFGHVFTSKMFLPELTLINIYDHSAEFRTSAGIEFFYCENTYETKVLLMSSWINEVPDVLRAQWFCDDIDELLMSCGPEETMEREISLPRCIDFGMEL